MVDVLLHSGTETSSGTGSPSSVGNALIGMFIDVSAASGTLPTLIVKLQHSPNGTDWYDSLVNGTAVATTGLTSVLPSGTQYVSENVRCIWTIGGVNPSFTFTVDVETVG
jgi:hypothetical protein